MNYKTVTIFSIIINTILVLIYFGYFKERTSFEGEKDITETLSISNINLQEYNNKRQSETVKILRRIPKMQKPYSQLFKEQEIMTHEFHPLIDRIIQQNKITEKDINKAFQIYNEYINRNFSLFKNKIFKIQHTAKLTDNEVNSIIMNFKENCVEIVHFKNSKSLNLIENKLLLMSIKNNFIINQVTSTNIFSSMFSTRNPVNNIILPCALTSNYEVKSGNEFNAQLCIGLLPRLTEYNHFSVDINGEKINLDKPRTSFYLEPTSTGNQEYECVVSWTNSISKKTESDTSYFNYTVID